MEIVKIFENGRSQAVRLPKRFRFSGEDYTLYELHVKDAVCSFPEGLTG